VRPDRLQARGACPMPRKKKEEENEEEKS